MDDQLGCWACGRTDTVPATRCVCGEPLWYEMAPPPDTLPAAPTSMWTAGAPLPVDPPPGVPGSVGGTPTVRVPALDRIAGCRVWLKDETRNPTGTFKDRGSAVGVAHSVAAGDGAVGTVSHGNMAVSVAANAAAMDAEAVVLVPKDIPTERLGHIGRFDPTVIRVAGDYGQLYTDTLEVGPSVGIAFLNSDVPTRVAGQKTLAYEVIATFDRPPDAFVLPVSSGGNASGVWKALRELRDAEAIASMPRIYLVQAAACAPIAAADREDADRVRPTTPEQTIAYSIANPDPPSGNRALAAARETGGRVIAVDDDAIRDAQDAIATNTGIAVEPASATTIAGLRALTDADEVDPDERVVAVATGTGYREAPPMDATPRVVSLDELPDELRSERG